MVLKTLVKYCIFNLKKGRGRLKKRGNDLNRVNENY